MRGRLEHLGQKRKHGDILEEKIKAGGGDVRPVRVEKKMWVQKKRHTKPSTGNWERDCIRDIKRKVRLHN